ncbi:sigma-54-dependent Fis family transcriptional regulator [Flexivirga oryzae]|uniref:Transcriptional regulator of acetoin/glycerol metabolism n=1 Tax=Flexivirga oryzae TaxID=1794944 RepID=A0A839N5S1_9MICO|nr:helix-turn-helix domain-containing protein [Flexivirga oryzae]MBB2890101.1 transcriptional regulator of acetoin/glycerol metabolism [Flexivirga oryzae]
MTSRSSSGRTLMKARERFLEGGSADGIGVRDEIRASWVRSRQLAVAADRVEPAQVERPHAQSLLLDCARPVLQDVAAELADEPVALLLTGPQGVVLDRICGDNSLVRRLDTRRLAPGFTYAESSVGTNGIGTALETRRPTLVLGGEHFAGDLCVFGCAGAPIIHPLTSALMGVVDLTSWAGDANTLLLSFARSVAGRIQDRLLERVSKREVALMHDYLLACQHNTGPVLALSNELTIMNAHTQQSFDAVDQSALLARVGDAAGSAEPLTLLADLPSGQVVRLAYEPAFTDTSVHAGGVVRVQTQVPVAGRREAKVAPPVRLPGVVGSSAPWQRVCRGALDSRRRGEWLVLEGEPGVGKLAVLTGVHLAVSPTEHIRVMDPASSSEVDAWLESVADELDNPGPGTLILRRAHELPDEAVSGLSELLMSHLSRAGAPAPVWVAVTMDSGARSAALEAELLPHFPHTLEVPPLRRRLDDLAPLADHFARRFSRDQELTISDAAMNMLRRMPWQGNVEQLRRVLSRAVRQRRTGVIDVDQLPPECRSVRRRRFTVMESLERDAIVEALDTHDGNKELAAIALGMSRATIYRKIKGYGIHLDAS